VVVFPAGVRLASDIEVKHVRPVVNPISDLMDDASAAAIRKEGRGLYCGALLQGLIVVPDGRHECAARLQFGGN